MTVNIMLSSINDVKSFVHLISKYDCEIDLVSGRYVIDAKSIMGIFSIDLTKPITLQTNCENEAKILEELSPFIVKE